MKRLTEKNEFGDYVGSNLLDDECLCRELNFDEVNEITECFNKLGKLEDIEEELGIDLITLFKALEDGFYARIEGDLSKIDLYDSVRLGIYHGRFVFYGVNSVTMRMIVVCVADKYHWALTKEELQ